MKRRDFIGSSTVAFASSLAIGDDKVQLAPPDKEPVNVEVPKPPKRKVGWAIVGLGQLAIEEILPAFAQCKIAEPVAFVSGHESKAKQLAKVYDVDASAIYDYTSFEKLAGNDQVDIVYIVLPNSMHAEYTIKAFEAKKHVLCEKPMATSTQECKSMIGASKKAAKSLMIAYRLRYEPFHMRAIDLCSKGELGTLRSIIASNGQDTRAPNIRLSRSLGGGPVQDVGIYCINAFRYLTREEPIEVFAYSHRPEDNPNFREVDATVSFALTFPSGLIAHGDCSFECAESRYLRVVGSKATMAMESAFAYRGQQLKTVDQEGEKVARIRSVDHFAAEMDYFSNAILEGGDVRTPGEEGLADIAIIAAIEESLASGKPVKIA